MVSRLRFVALTVALVAAAGACVSIGVKPNGPGRTSTRGADPEPRIPRTGDEPQSTERTGRDAAAISRREVVAKEPPSALVSRDGTRCTVDATRYERVKVGDRVLCVWTKNTDDPTP